MIRHKAPKIMSDQFAVVIKPYRLDDLLQKVEEMMKIRATRPAQSLATPSSPVRPVRESLQAIEIDEE